MKQPWTARCPTSSPEPIARSRRGALALGLVLALGAGTVSPTPAWAKGAGTVGFDQVRIEVDESSGFAAVRLERRHGEDGAVSVRLSTADGTADAGADYAPLDVVVSWADGDEAVKTVTLILVPDGAGEPDETILLGLTQPSGGASIDADTAQATVVIRAHDDNGGGGGGGGGGGDPGGEDPDKPLVLRVDPAIARPGGPAAVVLRTYAARPVRSGKIVVRVRRAPPARRAPAELASELDAVARLVSVTVFATGGDATATGRLVPGADGQTIEVDFASPSGTVNATDGPLAVLRFAVSAEAVPGDVYALEVDGVSQILSAGGLDVPLEPVHAELTVRAASDPIAVSAEGDEAAPGEIAILGIETHEPLPLASGRIELVYDPRLLAGIPTVRMDPRHGAATFTASRPKPGLLIVDFTSPDKSLNRVPGLLVEVGLTVRPRAAVGATSPVTLRRAGTWLRNARGVLLSLAIEDGDLVVRAPGN